MFFNTHPLDSMLYTDEFESEFAHATFQYARMTSDEVAEAVIKAVEKGRLYVVPLFSGRLFRWVKRIKPGFYHGVLAFLNRTGTGRSLFLWMACMGLVQ